ncbi:MAG: exodeoxyribonuclease III [Myxococcales bacterium]|nr:exodeoxyribonuclease III [Myxococcales bacterium]
MRVVTLNANGIRAAVQKGLCAWLARARADVVCLQEIRAGHGEVPPELRRLRSHRLFVAPATRPGYSGVALLCRREPDRVVSGIGWPAFDTEGRYLQADFGALSVASVYLPSGTSGELRQAFKMRALARFRRHLAALAASGREHLLCGDFNIAHRKIDLENWRGNQDHSGFLPEERAWLDALFGRAGWVDAFRAVCPEPRQYTWWSNRGRAWDRNVGWRIDYHVATPGLAARARAASIYKRRRFSDHAPLVVDYDGEL